MLLLIRFLSLFFSPLNSLFLPLMTSIAICMLMIPRSHLQVRAHLIQDRAFVWSAFSHSQLPTSHFQLGVSLVPQTQYHRNCTYCLLAVPVPHPVFSVAVNDAICPGTQGRTHGLIPDFSICSSQIQPITYSSRCYLDIWKDQPLLSVSIATALA